MPPQAILKLIKTECGRAKYSVLASKSGVLAQIRLIWFVFFAAIKDWNIPQPESKATQESNF